MMLRVLSFSTLFFLLIAPALAELPQPRFDRLKPLGASAGSTMPVEILGADIEGVTTLYFDHPGLSARHVKDRQFEIQVAADVPQGTYDVYLVGKYGISNPRLFAVSHGLTDVAEDPKNHSAAEAQAVALNVAINASADNNSEDFFRFTARKGQRLTIDCQAQRLDSDMDATLVLSTAEGQPLASNRDYFGSDPFLDFVAPADGDYLVAVYDLSYRGGYPYRLILSDRPQVENVFPAAVKAGQPATLTLFGRNLQAAQPSPWQENDLPLVQTTLNVTPPADVSTLGTYRFFEHPTHHSVLPTAATCTLTGFQVQSDGVASPFSAQPVMVTPFDVTLEAEPNDTQEQPQSLTIPAVVCGRFDRPRDADWYTLKVPENGRFALDVYSERIAGRADPYITILDEKGNRVSELDDFGIRMNAFDGAIRDPSGVINLNKDVTYRLLVQDRYQRGGARYQYVLSIRPPVPDFYVSSIHSSNQNPAGTTLWKGAAATLDIVIHQWEGYNGPITLTAENLPPGVHASPVTITNNTRGRFVLWADDDAADTVSPIRLLATGKRGEETFQREVRPYCRVWNNSGTSRPQRQHVLAVREKAPYALTLEPANISVKAGEKATVKAQLRRLWPEFTEKVSLQPYDFPGQFKLGKLDIPAGQTEATLEIEVQQNTPPGDYTLLVQGQGQVPFNKDAAATSKPNTLVSIPSRPVTITVLSDK